MSPREAQYGEWIVPVSDEVVQREIEVPFIDLHHDGKSPKGKHVRQTATAAVEAAVKRGDLASPTASL